jgi:integrase
MHSSGCLSRYELPLYSRSSRCRHPPLCARREPWNKGKLVGQKAPLKLKDIWAIRVRLEMFDRKRELALFNLAIDSKLPLKSEDFLFPSRLRLSPHLSTRQYARIVEARVTEIGLDAGAYGTHTMRRTKASLIYRRTKNLRAVQLLLGHSKLESTVRYLGIEVDDALEMAEQTEV